MYAKGTERAGQKKRKARPLSLEKEQSSAKKPLWERYKDIVTEKGQSILQCKKDMISL